MPPESGNCAPKGRHQLRRLDWTLKTYPNGETSSHLMRILCVAAAYPPHGKGGGPKASETIAKAIAARGHVVRAITVADDENFEVRDGVQVKTLRTLNLYWNYWKKDRSAVAKLLWHALENFNPRAFLRMRREMKEFRPDLVVTISVENVNVATWIAAWTLGYPTVHAIQSYFLMCWKGTMFSEKSNCERPCLQCKAASIGKKFCSQLVDGVIAEASHTPSLHREQGYSGARRRGSFQAPCVDRPAIQRSYHRKRCDPGGLYRHADAEQRGRHVGRGSSTAGPQCTVRVSHRRRR